MKYKRFFTHTSNHSEVEIQFAGTCHSHWSICEPNPKCFTSPAPKTGHGF